MVAPELEMTVFNVEGDKHASRIARTEIGQRLKDIPLAVLGVTMLERGHDEDAGDEDVHHEDARPDFDDLFD